MGATKQALEHDEIAAPFGLNDSDDLELQIFEDDFVYEIKFKNGEADKSSKATDLHKHFCGEWLVMCGGVGELSYLTAVSKGWGAKTPPFKLLVIPLSHFF